MIFSSFAEFTSNMALTNEHMKNTVRQIISTMGAVRFQTIGLNNCKHALDPQAVWNGPPEKTGGIPGRSRKQPWLVPSLSHRPEPLPQQYSRTWAIHGRNLHHQQRQSQRLYQGILSYQPPALRQRRNKMRPAIEIHIEIPSWGRLAKQTLLPWRNPWLVNHCTRRLLLESTMWRQGRPPRPSLVTLRHSTVSAGKNGIENRRIEQSIKATHWCMGSGFVTSSPTEIQKCRAMRKETGTTTAGPSLSFRPPAYFLVVNRWISTRCTRRLEPSAQPNP